MTDVPPPTEGDGVIPTLHEDMPYDVESAPFPGDFPGAPEEPIIPDHNADKVSPLDRVRRARDEREARRSQDAGRTRKTTPPKTRTKVPAASEAKLTTAMTEVYTACGIMLAPVDNECGMMLLANAEPQAASLAKLAQSNDTVRRVLLALTETSAWGGVIAAHLPLLAVVAYHHGPDNVRERVAPFAQAAALQAAEKLRAAAETPENQTA